MHMTDSIMYRGGDRRLHDRRLQDRFDRRRIFERLEQNLTRGGTPGLLIQRRHARLRSGDRPGGAGVPRLRRQWNVQEPRQPLVNPDVGMLCNWVQDETCFRMTTARSSGCATPFS
jgi:hypothetical protein